MAAEKLEIRGDLSWFDRLIVPRPISRLVLLLSFGLLAEALFRLLTKEALGYISSVAGALCLMCATAVWSMRDKLDDKINGEHSSAKEFQDLRRLSAKLRRQAMGRSVRVAICAILAASPTLSFTVTKEIWHWMVLLAGVATAEAIYGYMVANLWEEQLIAYRDRLVLASKRAGERSALLAKMTAAKFTSPSARPSTSASPTLLPH
jgi:hypothetical protein